jgi:RNA polymerase sigma factor (sigma-70 family)
MPARGLKAGFLLPSGAPAEPVVYQTDGYRVRRSFPRISFYGGRVGGLDTLAVSCVVIADPFHRTALLRRPFTMPPTTSAPTTVSTLDQSHWFKAEVHPHEPQLRSYLQGAFPAVRDIDDVVQESYLRMLRARARLSIRSAKAFLFEIARHVALDILRKQRGSPVNPVTDFAALPVFDQRPSAADVVCTQEELALLAAAVEALPARCREIVILRKIKRVPQKEIARMLGISEQTVQTQVFRGVRRCQKYLLQHGLQRAYSE